MKIGSLRTGGLLKKKNAVRSAFLQFFITCENTAGLAGPGGISYLESRCYWLRYDKSDNHPVSPDKRHRGHHPLDTLDDGEV